ncbi:unnamed protein product [Hymenolepis diminuta]|uniref:Uncharacterized protein n=1 Tax=Hymenolepis diminuta TaxID=6216 RepID=A0A564YWZ0_HYMDI|nr:unnamed protein product [Hymenolepis diminuta]
MQSADAHNQYIEITVTAFWDIMVAKHYYTDRSGSDTNQELIEQNFYSMAKNTHAFLTEYMRYLLFNEPKRNNYETQLHDFIFNLQLFASLDRERQLRFIGWMLFLTEIIPNCRRKWHMPFEIFYDQSDKIEEYYINCSRIARLLPRIQLMNDNIKPDIDNWQRFCDCVHEAAKVMP